MNHIARSSLIIAVFFGVDKVLGFIRQVLIARQFDLSRELDAFNAANNLPELIFVLISGGALAMAFIPVLSEYLEKSGRPLAWDLFSRIANLVFLVTATLSIFIAIFAEQLVSWRLGIAPGFDAEQRALVADLMRLNLIATLIFSISGLIIASLQANQHFLLPAMAPAMYDIGMLVGVLILAPTEPYSFGPITLPALGYGVHGLVYGVVLGALLFLGILIPGLIRFKFRWAPAINMHHPGVRQVLAVLAPRVGTVFFIQLIFFAQDNIASHQPPGAVTALVYAWLFMQVPESLIGTAIGTALLPTISEHIVRGQREAFVKALNHTMRVILALTLPSALLLGIGIRPVVGILGFDTAGVELVVWTTRAFLCGLAGHALLEVVVRAFYAQQNARTPLLAAALAAAAYIPLAIILARFIGVPGIALANAIVITSQTLILLWLLNKQYNGVWQVSDTLVRVIAISIISAMIVYGLLQIPLPIHPLPISISAMVVGGVLVLPFIFKEIRMLIKL
jgi:putative peptidoglycan lipid II flippase